MIIKKKESNRRKTDRTKKIEGLKDAQKRKKNGLLY
jgi:hypothetical protein